MAWETFSQFFNHICNKHAPWKQSKVKGYSIPWLDENIRELMYKRDNLKKQSDKSKNYDIFENYKKARNNVTRAIKMAKSEYFNKLIQENTGNIWGTLKKVLPSTQSVNINSLESDGKELSDPESISLSFNKFFTTIGSKLAEKFDSSDPDIDIKTSSNSTFTFKPITCEEVHKILSGLSTKKACGLDGISSRLLKEAAPKISLPLSIIFNHSVNSGTLPQEWKCAKVTPIYKDGSALDCSNYRPISVLPICLKVLEKIVHNQLYSYLKENEILCTNQSGFRPSHSTQTALIDVTDHILSNTSKGLYTGVIFIDFKKAFDTVDIPLMLAKLTKIGITNNNLLWFKNYLTNRTQCTSVGGHLSEALPIEYGVPQGSVLGPLLFILYINDLQFQCKKCRVVLYADDTAIFFASKSIQDIQIALNDDISLAYKWLTQNKLTLNVKKTKSMLFGTNKSLANAVKTDAKLSIAINGEEVEEVNLFKYLGLWFDPLLNWSAHLDKTCAKIRQRLGVIGRIRCYIDKSTAKTLVKAMIFPLFDYGDITWGTCSLALQERLQRLQNRAGKIVLKCPPRTPTLEVQCRLKWPPLSQFRNYHITQLVQKCLMNEVPPYLKDTFITTRATYTGVETRNSQGNGIFVPSAPNQSAQNKFNYRGACTWNALPPHLRLCNSSNKFKSLYWAYYWNNTQGQN